MEFAPMGNTWEWYNLGRTGDHRWCHGEQCTAEPAARVDSGDRNAGLRAFAGQSGNRQM